MDSYEIFEQADDIVRGCGTRDPFRIAEDLGIIVSYNPRFKDLLGMYTVQHSRNRFIFLNLHVSEHGSVWLLPMKSVTTSVTRR